jgi:Arc/MetJ-type ribon-helix-helix transcriptional regulator
MSRFFGVRLSPEENAHLESYRVEHQLPNRSEALRDLLKAGGAAGTTAVELPVTRLRELEQLVEDGYFTSVAAALESALEVGLRELIASHRDGLAELRRYAREMRVRRDGRTRADREGRGLLRR